MERIKVLLEFLWPKHGHQQVSEQQQGDYARNQVFHKLLLQLLAKADIQAADQEEQHRDTNIDKVIHNSCMLRRIQSQWRNTSP
jgi:hypothetical protein